MDKKYDFKTNSAIVCFLIVCLSIIFVWHFCFFVLVMGEPPDQFTFLGFAKDMFRSNGIGWLRAQLIYLLLLCLPIPFYLILFISIVAKFNIKLYTLAYISVRVVIISYSISAIIYLIYNIATSPIMYIYEKLLMFAISILVGCAFFVVPSALFSFIKSRQVKTST